MFDFPANPSINDTYTGHGITYRYTGVGWVSATLTTITTASDIPPTVPIDNALWYETDTSILWLRYNDSNSTQWIQISGPPQPASNLFLPLSGGTLTGGIAIQPTSGWASIDIKKPASGQASVITGQTGTLYRWWLMLGESTAESGSNVGSDFAVARWSDAGSLIDYPFKIFRSNGQAFFYSPLNAYQLLIKPGAGAASIILTGTANEVYGFSPSNNQGRWMMQLGNTATESGGNSGTNFALHRYADNGSYIDAPLTINRATGQMTLSQNLIINVSSPTLILAGPAGTSRAISSHTSTVGNYRWIMSLGDGAAETGSNAGSNFALGRYNDSGGYLETPFSIIRSNGQTRFTAGGFGPSSPSNATLYVTGASYGGGIVMIDGSGWAGFYCNNYGAQLEIGVGNSTSLTRSAYFTASATYNASGAWTSWSDISVKDRVETYTRGLSDLIMLRPVTFVYAKETAFADVDETPRLGLVAQEVQPYVPEIVGRVEGVIDEKPVSVLTLESGSLIFAVLNALREIDERLRNIESRL